MRAETFGRAVSASRTTYGLALLAAPDALAGCELGRGGRRFARLLGARQIVEALLVLGPRHATRRVLAVVVDVVHGVSALWLARRVSSRARPLHRNAAVAAAFALATWAAR